MGTDGKAASAGPSRRSAAVNSLPSVSSPAGVVLDFTLSNPRRTAGYPSSSLGQPFLLRAKPNESFCSVVQATGPAWAEVIAHGSRANSSVTAGGCLYGV